MSGKVKQRTSANAADSATQSVNEKILRECHSLYTDPDNGEFLLYIFLLIFFFPFLCHTQKLRNRAMTDGKSKHFDVMEN
jgi:hypothetical protein